MSHHYHPSQSHDPNTPEGAKKSRGQIHRTWWFWLAVILMLGVMLMYGLG